MIPKENMTPQEQYQYYDGIFGEYAKQALDDIETADNLTEVIMAVCGKLERALDIYDLDDDIYDELSEILEQLEESI